MRLRCGKKWINSNLSRYGFGFTRNQLISQMNMFVYVAGVSSKLNFADTICGKSDHGILYYMMNYIDIGLQFCFFFFFWRNFKKFLDKYCEFIDCVNICLQKIWINKWTKINTLHTDLSQFFTYRNIPCENNRDFFHELVMRSIWNTLLCFHIKKINSIGFLAERI